MLVERGAIIIDADAISRCALDPGSWGFQRFCSYFKQEISSQSDILTDDGSVNRKVLRELIFSDFTFRKKLNRALHLPIIVEMIKKLLYWRFIAWKPFVVLDAPLLLETGLHWMCKWVITVSAPEDLQVQRLVKRDGSTPEAAHAIIAAQMPLPQKIKLSHLVIDNSSSLEELRENVDTCIGDMSI